MTGSGNLRIARVRGVDLELHISLLLLLPYLVFVIAARFPVLAEEAGISRAALSFNPVIWGLLIAVSLFVSILLHEFAHVFVAQSLGVKVRSVTLMMLGGVSAMERVPERSYSEFKLALIGPFVSLALGGLLLYVHSFVRSPDLLFYAYWVGSLNLGLAVFNLLPAFPLDGGRALRSVLAARHGWVRATQTSVKISKVFSWIFGIWGLVSFNILLLLVAFFLYSAAQGELFFLLSRGILKGLRAGEVYRPVSPLRARDNLEQAAEKMLATLLPLLPVEADSGEPHLVMLNQIRRVPRDFWRVTLVVDIMEKAPRTLDVAEPLSEAFVDLASSSQGALPVTEKGQLVGVLRYLDVSQILQVRSLAGHGIEFENAAEETAETAMAEEEKKTEEDQQKAA